LHPSWTPTMVKGAIINTDHALPGMPAGSAGLISANDASSAGTDKLVSDRGLTPNSLLVLPGAGGGDPSSSDWTRSSWSRSSWSNAAGALNAPWARSSWSCTCSQTTDGGVDPARATFDQADWTTTFAFP
jgi:hypothetical protein